MAVGQQSVPKGRTDPVTNEIRIQNLTSGATVGWNFTVSGDYVPVENFGNGEQPPTITCELFDMNDDPINATCVSSALSGYWSASYSVTQDYDDVTVRVTMNRNNQPQDSDEITDVDIRENPGMTIDPPGSPFVGTSGERLHFLTGGCDHRPAGQGDQGLSFLWFDAQLYYLGKSVGTETGKMPGERRWTCINKHQVPEGKQVTVVVRGLCLDNGKPRLVSLSRNERV